MNITMKRVASVAAGLILALGLAACNEDDSSGTEGQSDKQEQDSSAPEEEDGEEAPEEEDQPEDGDELTLSGEVTAGTEPNCMLLEFEGETYQLTGEEAESVEADAEVEVTGKVAESTMTTCQEGTPFEVESVSVK